MKKNFSVQPFVRKREKPWGYELILTPAKALATGKILHVNKGHRFSLQYHDQKEETLCLLEGEAKLVIEDENGQLQEMKMEPKKVILFGRFRNIAVLGLLIAIF